MAKKKKKAVKKSKDNTLSPELIEKIRVTEEDSQRALDKLNYTITPRPEGEKKPKGKLWCCYCSKWHKFTNKKDSKTSYKRCHGCNISDEDFHIKTHNDLWNIGNKKK